MEWTLKNGQGVTYFYRISDDDTLAYAEVNTLGKNNFDIHYQPEGGYFFNMWTRGNLVSKTFP